MGIRQRERAISALLVRDEAEIARVQARFHTHAALIALGMIVCSIFFAIGVDEQIIVYFTWLLTGCQEYTDYLREGK